MNSKFPLGFTKEELDRFVEVGNKVADASGAVIRKYFRNKFEIIDKQDLSPVTIADKAAEESMTSIILHEFPSHAIYGEENGWSCKDKHNEYVWVLDPIDGTKSFITGKPLFGTLIALLHSGKPILGIIDQPILRERWIGISGRRTTLNGQQVSTRTCGKLSHAYLYTTSPHLFSQSAEEAFNSVRNKVKTPLYGCDCYAYALLASGFVDLVIESGLKPYDFLSLIPIIEGAGGVITDWKGHQLNWVASPDLIERSYDILAAGDKQIHQQALDSLQWQWLTEFMMRGLSRYYSGKSRSFTCMADVRSVEDLKKQEHEVKKRKKYSDRRRNDLHVPRHPCPRVSSSSQFATSFGDI